jgi:hypothetical protein
MAGIVTGGCGERPESKSTQELEQEEAEEDAGVHTKKRKKGRPVGL